MNQVWRRLEFRLTGVVQGVTLRANTDRFCARRGLSGFIKNESDGSVSLVVEGEPLKLAELIAWLKRQPIPGAQITIRQMIERQPTGEFRGFKIIW